MKSLRLLFIIMCITVGLTACSTGSLKEEQPLPELSFAHYEPLGLEIARIEIESGYDPMKMMEDISEQFPVPPDVALKTYLRQRLRPAGDQGLLIIDITDAKVNKRVIEPEGFFSSLVGVGDKDRFQIELKILMILKPGPGQEVRTTSILADRSLTLPESLSLYERDKAKLEMVERLINEIDPVLTGALQDSLQLQSG